MRRTKPLTERFWGKVSRESDGCWEWQASADGKGYGQIGTGTRDGRKNHRAHRIAWTLVRGAIPDGLYVLHRCDNRRCVRPDHLFLGTARDNTHDMLSKGRGRGGTPKGRQSGEMHGCHKLTTANVLAIRASSERRAVLSARYGITEATVGKIIRLERWGHLQ